MKPLNFFDGVLVALVASLVGSGLVAILSPLFPDDVLLRLLIAGLGLGYVLYLLRHSRERMGRVTAVAVWITVAAATSLLALPLTLYVLVHLGMIWLVRSLYYYSSLLSALLDLGLNGLSLAAASWALDRTGSLFLALWCLFLVQALFVAIPAGPNAKAEADNSASEPRERFQQARDAADHALRGLSSTQRGELR